MTLPFLCPDKTTQLMESARANFYVSEIGANAAPHKALSLIQSAHVKGTLIADKYIV